MTILISLFGFAWDTLYRIRLQIERDLLVHAEPGTVFPGHILGARDRPAPARPAPDHGVRRRAEAPRSATTPS